MRQHNINVLIAFGPRVRKSPFFDATVRYGAKAYTIYNHMYMPLYYDSFVNDYWRLINDVTLWDVSCQRQVEITGPDAFNLFRRLTPRNLDKCAVGQGMYALITDENGGILNDPVLLKLSENHFWLSLADSDILPWVKGLALAWGMDVTVTEPDVSPLALQGPKSHALMVDLFGDWIKKLKFFWFREIEFKGMPMVIAKSGWSTQGGYELYLRDGRYGEDLWEMIMEAGQLYNIGPGAPSPIERVEGGLLSYRTDMDETNNPYEVGLGKYVDVDQKTDFMGKAALRRVKAEGIKQKLVGLEVHAEPLDGNEHQLPVLHNGEPSGRMSTVTYSPRLDKNIALAIVPIAKAELGTNLTIEAPRGPIESTVVPIPFAASQAKVQTTKQYSITI